MSEARAAAHLDEIAAEAFSMLGTGGQIAPFSSRYQGFGLEDAYRITAKVRALREKAGEAPRGRKIGFTNRTIWAEYGVYAPIWCYVYDRTVHDLDNNATFALAGLSDPRIEPEIVFGLTAAPRPRMESKELLSCIGWVAQGFEIVQSVFPAWRFAAADAVAASGMHGALLIGSRRPLRGAEEDWAASLSNFEIDLSRNDELADRGSAGNVLDGPLLALPPGRRVGAGPEQPAARCRRDRHDRHAHARAAHQVRRTVEHPPAGDCARWRERAVFLTCTIFPDTPS